MHDEKRIYVKPAISPTTGKPLQVRWPTKPSVSVPPEGMYVPRDAHWLRRLQDGSVIEATPPRPAPKKSSSKE